MRKEKKGVSAETLYKIFIYAVLIALAVVYASTALPFTIYLLSGYFATLPHDFEEAAYIDGATYSQAMIRIIFPMAQPSIITIILFNFLLQYIYGPFHRSQRRREPHRCQSW